MTKQLSKAGASIKLMGFPAGRRSVQGPSPRRLLTPSRHAASTRGLASGPCDGWGPWPSGPRSCAVRMGGNTRRAPATPQGAAGRRRLKPGRPGPGSARKQGLPAETTQPAGLLLAAASMTAGPAATGSTLPRSPRAQSAIVRGSGPGLRQRIRHRLLRRGSHGKGLPAPPLALGPAASG